MESTLLPSQSGDGAGAGGAFATGLPSAAPQYILLDFFFPGFSVFSAAVTKYLHIDLNVYIPLVLLGACLTFAWRSLSETFWQTVESHAMSVVDIRTDDEIYNMLMTWVAAQRFAQGARRFVVNTNLSSRSWFAWRWENDEDNEADDGTVDDATTSGKKKKALAYTPTFGSHWFWYRGRLLIFRRTQNRESNGFLVASEREEISISCFGRNPWILKELLHEAREAYVKRDQAKTLIYRGSSKNPGGEPTWQRCMARTSRPFSTVILNEKVKKDLIDDVTDYLHPATRRWYSNRGIPYRRGYLLHGPPGTGKSSLSLALAGFFKMRIYIVSLSSVTSNEENLAALFAELPRRCVVLLEDIDTAGLTHTRENNASTSTSGGDGGASDMVPGQVTPGKDAAATNNVGRLSLSGLLNILDGVASQEGRVLIMTTNHVEKLDKALIRPGRVDMIVKFDRADHGMTAAIFRAIFAPLEGDDAPVPSTADITATNKLLLARPLDPEAEKKKAAEAAEAARKKDEIIARVGKLAEEFAAKVPEHEFSPAEIQGFLLKNKRNPEAAVEGADKWIVERRKERQEKEILDAEKKKEEEKKKKEEEEKKKKEEEEEKKKKEEEEKKEKKEKRKEAKRKAKKASRRSKRHSGSDDSSDSSDEGSESEAEESKAGKKKRKSAGEEKDKAAVVTGEATKAEAEAEAEAIPTVVVVEAEAKVEEVEARAKTPDQETKHGMDSGYGTPTGISV
ncbi:BCS1 N terminal-domain-containing protein [Cercophora scortea]|uniref:BCS1 N terminal-domain-containing protein n=1 Tax=Cercophora scortea TaxID=314031 RepID=A0AAE0IZN8_9PEZI|nr:BCS1 N terminal-domain-containing protein [Cercophora scortea]